MKLFKYLEEKNLSIRQFSKISGVSRSLLRKVRENGNINLDSAAKIIKASNGTITYLDLLPEENDA